MIRLFYAFIMAAMLTLVLARPASALISFSLGNDPVQDQDWPAGSVELVNLVTRVANWDGPLGGAAHFGFRGDTAEFQAALDQFAKIRAPQRDLIIQEGPEVISFLKIEGKDDGHVDWTFDVWDPRSFFSGFGRSERAGRDVPAPLLKVRVAAPGGPGVNWSKIKVPSGLHIMDERATAAGYAREDGSVIRGDVYDLLTSKPIASALISIQKWKDSATVIVAEARADEAGHFEFKHISEGAYYVSASAPGRVARTIATDYLGANSLKEHVVRLTAAVTVRGTAKDPAGNAIEGVEVSADTIRSLDGQMYGLTHPAHAITDAKGNFELNDIPEGQLQFRAINKTRVQLNVLKEFKSPSADISLLLTVAGAIKGRVLKPDGTPDAEANVSVNPPGERASRIGEWGGSTKVNPDGTYEFKNVPPDDYVISTKPLLPANIGPASKSIHVKPGETVEVDLAN